MNYIGRILPDDVSTENLMEFLTEALLLVPVEYPYRGPSQYENGDFHWFSGIEEVFHKNIKVYELVFHGGVVK